MRLVITLLLTLLATPALAQPADLVLRGGKIITVDKDWRVAQAVAIRDGRFVAVGDDEAMVAAHRAEHAGDRACRQDRRAGPDRHAPASAVRALNGPRCSCSARKSVADVQKAIAERVARTDAGKWVTASIGLAREHPRRRPHADAA